MRAKNALKTCAVAVATILLAAACGSGDDSGGGSADTAGLDLTKPPTSTTTVKVGVLGLVADAPFFVADTLGYFKDQGITVDFQTFQSGADMIPAIASGQLDVGWGQYTAGLFNAFGRGIDVKLVASAGSVDTNTTSGLYVSTRSGLQPGDVAGLAGKKLAVNGQGLGAQAYLHMMLKKNGVDDKAVKVEILSLPNQVAALASGSIDGAFLVDPLTGAVVGQGTGKKFATNYEMAGGTEHQIAGVLYSPQFSGKTETASRFMMAYLKASDLVNKAFGDKDPTALQDVAKGLMAHVQTVKSADALKGYYVTGGAADVDTASIQMFLDAFKELGLVTAPNVDFKKYIDASFGEAAQRALGATAGSASGG
ncbi:ABC transporter substrate-binding protein [Asanoa iriomotensis]|uniref:ABC transporter substrate-binding protein n=1 Tax=Asanoa iriomotensis TaxID=234613 RepID=A0ABQ4BWV6_9ACTN|nr:ABC transporter substrate-binding protein [Asanoa iriomotensis]GIF54641.1 ABC transporter substrate-binding protein [Asanoa iriomotensis]